MMSRPVFFQNRYFVRINSSGRQPPAREAILACAQAVSAKLPPSFWPRELGLIQAPGITSPTEKLVAESLLGYRFFPRGLTVEGDSQPGLALFSQDQLYKGILLQQRDSLLYGIAKIDDPAKARALLDRWLSSSR